MLPAILEKLDGLHEAIAKEYKKVELAGGGVEYHLDVGKVRTFELTDTAPLMGTIERLRQHEARVQKYGTLTPEEALANKAKVAELTAALENAQKDGKGGDERVRQVRTELENAHKAAIELETKRSSARLAEVVRLRKKEAARAAAVEVGFKKAARLVARELEDQIEVVEDETATSEDARFKTIVKGSDGVPRRVVPKEGGDRLMTPLERARELAIDPEWKPYLDAPEEPAPKNKPSSRHTPAPSSNNQPGDKAAFVDPVQDLASVFGAT